MRRFRDAYKRDYVDELRYKQDLDEIEKLMKHESAMNELRRRKEWTEQIRYIYDMLPDIDPFARQENDFLAAEQRMDRRRIDAGVCFETARAKSAPLRVEIDLTDRQFSARSIAPRPARQH